jgi:uncharacterized protein (DUF2267 family)
MSDEHGTLLIGEDRQDARHLVDAIFVRLRDRQGLEPKEAIKDVLIIDRRKQLVEVLGQNVSERRIKSVARSLHDGVRAVLPVLHARRRRHPPELRETRRQR